MIKKPTIAIILPRILHPSAFLNMSEDVVFIEGVLEGGAELAKKAEKNGIQCIISRGSTSVLISNAVSIPVVPIEATSYDVLETILNMHNDYPDIRDVALLNFYSLRYDVDTIGKITNLIIDQFWYQNFQQMKDAVNQAYQRGIRAIIGSPLIGEYAEQLGMKWFLLQIGKEATIQAIKRARSLVNVTKLNRYNDIQMRQIFDNLQYGIIAIDQMEIIVAFNETAESLLCIKKSDAIGKSIKELLPHYEWKDILKKDNFHIHSADGSKIQVSIDHLTNSIDHSSIHNLVTLKSIKDDNRLDAKRSKWNTEKSFIATFTVDDIIGRSRSIMSSKEEANLVARSDSPVLIWGESGTGKEIFAQAIHNLSNRKNGPFIAINCAAFPQHLLESELFGYDDGAFTGAKKGGKKGFFELANGGTLFLDEIGEMPIELQSRLLRVLEQQSFMRIGGEKTINVNARIISATNRNLKSLIARNEFRSDLFYRINILHISLSPLRDHKEDIPLLIEYFIKKYSSMYNKKIFSIDSAIMASLCRYNWPGNVRELTNYIERLIVLSHSVEAYNYENVNELILDDNRTDDLQLLSKGKQCNNVIEIKINKLDTMLNEIIRKMCALKGNNIKEVAELLGISRTTVWKRRKLN